ncbi:MAG TPA: O-antigen ligase family protein [Pyrinomonadaceae bacterium]|nr:O-antigen ligase family protein [Pyrinomonadaceae bacterium]
MRDGHVLADYEAVKPLRRAEPDAGGAAVSGEEAAPAPEAPPGPQARGRRKRKEERPSKLRADNWVARRGHLVTYAGLFLFTFFVYFRPYELFALPALDYGAQFLAIFTLLAYFPSQLSAEGNLTARPREVVLALLLLAAALLSVPTAVSPGEAWDNTLEFGKVILIFVVAVNVVRTERRLRGLLVLVMAASLMLSFNAYSDYAAGRLELRGERVKGMLGGMFDNPNDLALHLVTMVPLAVGLAFARRGLLRKAVYLVCAVLFTAGIVVSFSRGGFLGFVACGGVLAWKYGRKRRVVVMTLTTAALVVFIAAAPGGYGQRISSMFGGDATGSYDARRDVFWRSMLVALRHPVNGIGLGNFHHQGQRNQVSHNAYTQVAAEMGMGALAVYLLFMVSPLRRLREVERETFGAKDKDRAAFYHLAVGMQASLVGYMVCSFFASVAHIWYVYYLVAYAVCLRRLYVLKFGEPGAALGERKKGEGALAPAGGAAPSAAGLTL